MATRIAGVGGGSSDALAAAAGAPLFTGMGDHHHPITTTSLDAQRYFNQGLVIDFAFNHAESIRSFRAAQRLDDSCAMCFWGEALPTWSLFGLAQSLEEQGKADEARQRFAEAWALADVELETSRI